MNDGAISRVLEAVRSAGLDSKPEPSLDSATRQTLDDILGQLRTAALDGSPANARAHGQAAAALLEEKGLACKQLEKTVIHTLEQAAPTEDPARLARQLLATNPSVFASSRAGLRTYTEAWAAEKIADASQPKSLTFKTVAMMLLGSFIFVMAYPYLILKAGIASGISVVTAFTAFAMQKAVRWNGRVDVRETNMIQTFAASSAYLSFMVVVLAAMSLLGILPNRPWLVGLWLGVLGILGTWMVTPLRHQMLEVERLPFPDGGSVARLLLALENPRGSGAKQAKALAGAGACAGLFVIAKDWFKAIPDTLLGTKFGGGFEPAPMLIASGVIIGQEESGRRTMFWAAAASLITWTVAASYMVDSGLAREVAGVFGMTPLLAKQAYYPVLMRWTMWPATMIMVAHGLTSLAFNWRHFAASLTSLKTAAQDTSASRQDVAMGPLLGGVIFLGCVLGVLQYILFGLSSYVTLMTILVAIPLMVMGLRVKGLTGLGPVSVIGSVIQLVFGILTPGSMAANMAASAGGATIACVSEAQGDEFKAGMVVGNAPRSLVKIQTAAMPFAAIILSVLAFPLIQRLWGFGEHGLPAPTAHKWQGLAQVLSKGFSALPHSSVEAMAVAVAAGIALAVIESFTKGTRWSFWTPSAVGIGLAMLLPMSTMLPMTAGSLLAWILARYWRADKTYTVPAAAGAMVGDALTSLLGGVLKIAGVLH